MLHNYLVTKESIISSIYLSSLPICLIFEKIIFYILLLFVPQWYYNNHYLNNSNNSLNITNVGKKHFSRQFKDRGWGHLRPTYWRLAGWELVEPATCNEIHK